MGFRREGLWKTLGRLKPGQLEGLERYSSRDSEDVRGAQARRVRSRGQIPATVATCSLTSTATGVVMLFHPFVWCPTQQYHLRSRLYFHHAPNSCPPCPSRPPLTSGPYIAACSSTRTVRRAPADAHRDIAEAERSRWRCLPLQYPDRGARGENSAQRSSTRCKADAGRDAEGALRWH